MPPTDYIVVFKADSHARFRRPEESMSFDAEPELPIFVTVRSRFTDEGHEAAVPRELMMECRVRAPSMDAAIESAFGFAAPLAYITGFVTNAAVGQLRLYLAVEATDGLPSREFMEEFGEFDNGPVKQGRAITPEHVAAVLNLTSSVPHIEAGWPIAALQYGFALQRWGMGTELFALSHLYTAVEALEKMVVLQEADRAGLSIDELLVSIDAKDLKQAGAYYRREVIFGGDKPFLDEVKAVSDGLEHGSMSISEVEKRSGALAPRVFKLLRSSMIDRLSAPQDLKDALVGERYGTPLDPSLRKVVHGQMLNLPGELGPPGSAYPFLTWDTGLASLAFDDDGELQGKMAENFRVHTADGGAFKAEGLRWYARPTDPNKPPVHLTDVTVTVGSAESADDNKPDSK